MSCIIITDCNITEDSPGVLCPVALTIINIERNRIDTPPPAGESATTAITNYMVCLAREGKAEHIHFLLALRATETHVLPKTFKDVAKLPADSKKR